jgi:plastocyanin
MVALVMGVGCSSDNGSSDAAPYSGANEGSKAEAPFEINEEPVSTTEVDLPKSYRFDPVAITVDAGDKVTWTNNDDFPHNVHLLNGTDMTENLPIGETVTMTFDEPGEFYYECSIHPQQMQGKIVVN